MERRKTLRRVVKFPIKGSCGTEGHVYDISQTGLGFSLRRPELSPDSICVDFSPYFSSLDLPVRTVWKKRSPNGDGLLCGGRFAGLDENSEKAIDKILQEKDKIVTASYLPERVVTNQEIIDAGLKATPAILERALGVKERRAAAPDETGADMMAKVAKDILKKASLSPLDIDRIICSGDPGDSAAPDTAVAVQAKIAATCPAYSVSMSCVGWVAGLEIALNHLSSTDAKRILVLASSLVGSRLYFHNLRDRTIFGDAAGGILVERHHLKKILAINLWTAGAYYSKIYVPYPWSASPADIPSEYKGSFYMSP
ncbi:MAG: PilZ domain-containing protein, partial [Candidatus Omnitrophota bacterium]